jgi:RIO kinase 1
MSIEFDPGADPGAGTHAEEFPEPSLEELPGGPRPRGEEEPWREGVERLRDSRQPRLREPQEPLPGVYFSALGGFFSEGLIRDVLMLIKSGKEATVYCCQAAPETGLDLVAAKVYRPLGVKHNSNPQAAYEEAALRRTFERKIKIRKFKRDSRYQEGRVIQDARLRRAYEHHSRKGREVQNSHWAVNEYETLSRLYAAGAHVPRPLAQSGNALLMEYVGDASGPAPTLQEATLDRAAAPALFRGVLDNLALWLACGRVHADLSSFNLMYWAGRVVAIDFPQAVDADANPHAFDFLRRDVGNVCRHFARYGVPADPEEITLRLWEGSWDEAGGVPDGVPGGAPRG